MIQRVNDIVVTITVDDQEYKLETYQGEYRSLMMLIYDRIYIDDFGQCGGTGRCRTCLVDPVGAPEGSAGQLSCQIMVDPSLHNHSFKVLS